MTSLCGRAERSNTGAVHAWHSEASVPLGALTRPPGPAAAQAHPPTAHHPPKQPAAAVQQMSGLFGLVSSVAAPAAPKSVNGESHIVTSDGIKLVWEKYGSAGAPPALCTRSSLLKHLRQLGAGIASSA